MKNTKSILSLLLALLVIQSVPLIIKGQVNTVNEINNNRSNAKVVKKSVPVLDSLKKVEVQRIISLIDSFFNKNINYNEIAKKTLLTKLNWLPQERVNSLIWVFEPVFEVKSNCKTTFYPKKDSLFEGAISLMDIQLYNIQKDSNYQTVYSCITEPQDFNEDSIVVSARLYNYENEQEYLLGLVMPTSSWSLRSGGKMENDKNIEIYDYLDFIIKKRKISIPINIKAFTINYHSWRLERFLIYKDRIYSISCLDEKFPDLHFDTIVKEYLNEINDCDIDIEFTKKE